MKKTLMSFACLSAMTTVGFAAESSAVQQASAAKPAQEAVVVQEVATTQHAPAAKPAQEVAAKPSMDAKTQGKPANKSEPSGAAQAPKKTPAVPSTPVSPSDSKGKKGGY